MADMYGRLTGRAGVCLGTLGPGAMNLVTAIGDAFLDRAPLVALTGQADLERMHKESHQFIDLVELFRPITKWNARVASPEIIPEVVRKAFKVAESEKPGATHLELPEDVMAAPLDAAPLPRRRPVEPEPAARELLKAVDLIRNAINPGRPWPATASCAPAARPALREFCRATGIAVAETFMGKGLLDYTDPKALGTVGLHSRDYAMAGFEEADVVIAIGYDLVEHAPLALEPAARQEDRRHRLAGGRDRRVLHARGRADRRHLPRAHAAGRGVPRRPALRRARSACATSCSGRFEQAKDDDGLPDAAPAGAVGDPPGARREDILISDVGLHKLWIGRMFPAHEPNTVLIANGLAGMGFALPCAVAAKLVHPDARWSPSAATAAFLMNCQELETAMRLKTPFVNVIWENRQFGSIVWKQDNKFGEHFGVDFTNPDFVRLAEAFGMPAWRCEGVDDLGRHLRHALSLDVPSLIVLPIDYSIDVAISELGTETVST
jgi:acetolactate synthase-1/2/3 large subunit